MARELYYEIVEVFSEKGPEVLQSNILANILADKRCFVNDGKMLHLMRNLLDSGYGVLLHSLLTDQSSDWKRKTEDYLNEFISMNPKDAIEIRYLSDCLLFGIGLSSVLPIFSTASIFDDLRQMLADCQKEYMTLLQSSLLIKELEDGSCIPYYNMEGLNKLYAFEARIYVLLQQLGMETDWCEHEKHNIMERNSKTPQSFKSLKQNKENLKNKSEDKTTTREMSALKRFFNKLFN